MLPIADALALVKRYASATSIYYPTDETIPIAGVIRPMWRDLVVEKDKEGETRINRVNDEERRFAGTDSAYLRAHYSLRNISLRSF